MARVKVEEAKSSQEEVRSSPKGGGLYFFSPKEDIQFISSGCTTLDLALGGGWARRRIANIVGDSSSGKTLLAIEAAANFSIIEAKGKIKYRETEDAFDQKYAAALGFPIDRVDFGEPMDTIEDIFEDLEKVIEAAKEPELYIIDSLDALSDRGEMERDINAGSYGAQKAKKLSELFRRLNSGLSRKDITVIIISQIRDDINATYGRKTKRSGGRALNFYSSQVLYLSKPEKIYRTISNIKRVVGVDVRAQVDKNKIALPYREAQFQIMFGHGVDDYKSCADFWKQVTGEIVSKKTTLEELQRMVTKEWWEIEEKFLKEVKPKYSTKQENTNEA